MEARPAGSARSRAKAADQRLGPRPGARQAQGRAPARAHDPPGDVQQALAQPLGLGEGELALEAERRVQASRSWAMQRELQPDLVVLEGGEGQVAHAGVLAAADLVLDLGAAAVAQLQGGDVVAVLVGDEGGVAVALGVEDLELGAGMGTLAAHDQPRALGPGGEVDVGRSAR